VALLSGFMTVRYASAGEIIGRHFDGHAVAFENANAEAAELAGDGREHSCPVVEGHAERRARKDFGDGPFEFDQIFFGDTVLWV
jgi:hypothetical protein